MQSHANEIVKKYNINNIIAILLQGEILNKNFQSHSAASKKDKMGKVKENKKYRYFLIIGLAPHEEDPTQVLPTHVTNAGMLITLKQAAK